MSRNGTAESNRHILQGFGIILPRSLKDLAAFIATRSEKKNTTCDKPGVVLGPGDLTINRLTLALISESMFRARGQRRRDPVSSYLHQQWVLPFFKSLFIDITYRY